MKIIKKLKINKKKIKAMTIAMAISKALPLVAAFSIIVNLCGFTSNAAN